MKRFKKLLSLLLIFSLMLTILVFNASAFGGYTHFTMGVLKAALSDRSDQAKLAYYSGCLLADIGSTTWDNQLREWYKDNNYPASYYEKNSNGNYNKKYFASDEFLFMDAMYDVSKYLDDLSASAKIMAYGWRDHYIQDQKGSVFNIPSRPSSNYAASCAWIDEYFRDQLKLCDYPIQNNEMDEIYVSYKLINRTYRAITNDAINPSVADIQNEILDMFAMYDAAIALLSFTACTDTQSEEITNELDRVIALCPGIVDSDPANHEDDLDLPILTSVVLRPSLNASAPAQTSINANSTVSVSDMNNVFTDSDLKELTRYMEIEETPISDSEAYLKISINDKSRYSNTLNNLCIEKAELMKVVISNEQS